MPKNTSRFEHLKHIFFLKDQNFKTLKDFKDHFKKQFDFLDENEVQKRYTACLKGCQYLKASEHAFIVADKFKKYFFSHKFEFHRGLEMFRYKG